jgi:hypothetical protein
LQNYFARAADSSASLVGGPVSMVRGIGTTFGIADDAGLAPG